MKYYLWIKQANGCDYTIACGEHLIELGSSTMMSARQEAHHALRDLGWGPTGDIELKYARVLAVADESELDLNAILAAARRVQNEFQEAAQGIRDEAEFERLKRKLGRP